MSFGNRHCCKSYACSPAYHLPEPDSEIPPATMAAASALDLTPANRALRGGFGQGQSGKLATGNGQPATEEM